MPISRRTLSAGMLAGFSGLSALLASPRATAGNGARHCLTVLYPWGDAARFDFDYYRDTHLVQMRQWYGDAIGRMEIRKGLRQGDGSPPAYIASVTIEIQSMEAFDAAGKTHLPRLLADVPNYTDITPLGQIEEILAAAPGA